MPLKRMRWSIRFRRPLRYSFVRHLAVGFYLVLPSFFLNLIVVTEFFRRVDAPGECDGLFLCVLGRHRSAARRFQRRRPFFFRLLFLFLFAFNRNEFHLKENGIKGKRGERVFFSSKWRCSLDPPL